MTEGSRTLAQVIRDLFSSGKSGVNTLIGKIIDIKETKVKAEDGQEYDLLSSHKQPVKGDIAVFVKTVDGLLYALTGIVVETVTRRVEEVTNLLANIKWAIRTMEAGLFGLGEVETTDGETKLSRYVEEEEKFFDEFSHEALPNIVTTFFESTSGKVFFNSEHVGRHRKYRTAFSGIGVITIVSDSTMRSIPVNLTQPEAIASPSVVPNKDLIFTHSSITQPISWIRERFNSRREKYAKVLPALPSIKVSVRVTQTGPSYNNNSGWYKTPCFITVDSVEEVNFDVSVNLSNASGVSHKINNYNPMGLIYPGYPRWWSPHPADYATVSVFASNYRKYRIENDGSLTELSSGEELLCENGDKDFGGVAQLEIIKPNYYRSDTPRSGKRVYTHVIKHNGSEWEKTFREMHDEFGFPNIFMRSIPPPGYYTSWLLDITPASPEVLEIQTLKPYSDYVSLLSSKNIFEFSDLIGSGFPGLAVGAVELTNFSRVFPLNLVASEGGGGAWVPTPFGDEKISVLNKFDDGSEEIVFLEEAENCAKVFLQLSGYTLYIGFESRNAEVIDKRVAQNVSSKTPILNNCSIQGVKGLLSAIMIPPEAANDIVATLGFDFLVSFSKTTEDYLKDFGLSVIRLMSLAISGGRAYFLIECVDTVDDSLAELARGVQFYPTFASYQQINNASLVERRRKFLVGVGSALLPDYVGQVIRISEEDFSISRNYFADTTKLRVDGNSGALWYDDDDFKVGMDYYLLDQPVGFMTNVLPEFNAEFGPLFIHMAVVPSGEDSPVLLYCDKENEDDEKYVQKVIILS